MEDNVAGTLVEGIPNISASYRGTKQKQPLHQAAKPKHTIYQGDYLEVA